MSNLEHAANSAKKKMGIHDYPTDVQQNIQTSIHQGSLEPKQQKVKMTVYLTEEHWAMFNELCLDEMRRCGKPEKSQVVCDAIQCLYKNRRQTIV